VSGLDLPMREQVIALLQDICRNSGMGLLVVSHDISMVASLCERTVVIHAGEIIEDGATSRVLTDPQHPTTRDLLEAIPSLGSAA
jgi:peptide/nickel transport system ATP-binding protein